MAPEKSGSIWPSSPAGENRAIRVDTESPHDESQKQCFGDYPTEREETPDWLAGGVEFELVVAFCVVSLFLRPLLAYYSSFSGTAVAAERKFVKAGVLGGQSVRTDSLVLHFETTLPGWSREKTGSDSSVLPLSRNLRCILI
jgi:hypothetical protein